MIHLQAHYHTILTFGTKYKSLYRNDHTIYTNTLNIHLFGIFLVRTVSQEARSLTNPQFLSNMIGLRTSASPGVAGLTRRPSDWYLRVKITRGFFSFQVVGHSGHARVFGLHPSRGHEEADRRARPGEHAGGLHRPAGLCLSGHYPGGLQEAHAVCQREEKSEPLSHVVFTW